MSAREAIELHGSRILIGAGLLDECGAELRAALPRRRLAIITDDTVAALHGARLASACGSPTPSIFTVPAGESSKTRKQWSRLTDELLAARYGRDSAILALGGGVVGDLAGFVAATYMRGIPVVQLPTTLLAMLDAAIGGKTGVDTKAGKNLVGAFHHPAMVIVDARALATLPVAHLRNGLAEAVKHAVIASPADLVWLASNASGIARTGGPGDELAERLLRRNIRIKVDVVSRDERETGIRKILNFGHTIGHAVESLSGFSMLHGECVAIGMVIEARIAALAGIGEPGLAGVISQVLSEAGLPTALPAAMSAGAVLDATRMDKKARDGVVEYALPARLGVMAGADRGYAIQVDDRTVLAALEQVTITSPA
ncbi:MAG: 3-dehydroquinate synthase [Gemmatimonadales bacterium]